MRTYTRHGLCPVALAVVLNQINGKGIRELWQLRNVCAHSVKKMATRTDFDKHFENVFQFVSTSSLGPLGNLLRKNVPMRHRAVLVVLATLSSAVLAQTPAPLAFEVASIKRNTENPPRTSVGAQPGGRWIMSNGSVAMMIDSAYP